MTEGVSIPFRVIAFAVHFIGVVQFPVYFSEGRVLRLEYTIDAAVGTALSCSYFEKLI